MALRSDVAILMGCFISQSLWGLYTGLFFATLWVSYKRGVDRMGSWAVLAIIAIWLLNSSTVLANMVQNYEAYAMWEGGPLAFFVQKERHEHVYLMLGDIITAVGQAISDSMLLWRLYIVWGRNVRVMMVPVMIFTGYVVCGIAMITYDALKQVHGQRPAYATPYNGWTTAMFVLTLAFNWLTCGLIVGKLWFAQRRLNQQAAIHGSNALQGSGSFNKQHPYTKVIIAMVEGGTLLSIVLIPCMLVHVFASRQVSWIVLPIVPIFVGIMPTAIVLQRALGYLQPNDKPSGSTVAPFSEVYFAPTGGQSTHFGVGTITTHVRPVLSITTATGGSELNCKPSLSSGLGSSTMDEKV